MDYFDTYIGGSQVLYEHLLIIGLDLQSQNLTSVLSSFCGHYCVYFILFRCRGVSLHAIVSDFTSNLTENDRSISRFIHDVSQR